MAKLSSLTKSVCDLMAAHGSLSRIAQSKNTFARTHTHAQHTHTHTHTHTQRERERDITRAQCMRDAFYEPASQRVVPCGPLLLCMRLGLPLHPTPTCLEPPCARTALCFRGTFLRLLFFTRNLFMVVVDAGQLFRYAGQHFMCVARQYMHLERKLRHMGPSVRYLQGHICFCTSSSILFYGPLTFPRTLPVRLSSIGDLDSG